MAHIGRELNDVQEALEALLDRWPRARAATPEPDAQSLLADAAVSSLASRSCLRPRTRRLANVLPALRGAAAAR